MVSLATDYNFDLQFTVNKYKPIIINHTPSTSATQMEKNITKRELTIVLESLKGCTPGLNRLSYPMIKNSSSIVQDRIVSQFNKIFNTYIPQSYKTNPIIPILKPNTNKTDITSYISIVINCCIG